MHNEVGTCAFTVCILCPCVDLRRFEICSYPSLKENKAEDL